MNFDFKVVAGSFPAVLAVIGFACFFIGQGGLGVILILVAVALFVLVLFVGSQGSQRW